MKTGQTDTLGAQRCACVCAQVGWGGTHTRTYECLGAGVCVIPSLSRIQISFAVEDGIWQAAVP